MLIMLSSYVNKTSMNKEVEKRKYRNSIIKQNWGESSLSFFLIKKLENWKIILSLNIFKVPLPFKGSLWLY